MQTNDTTAPDLRPTGACAVAGVLGALAVGLGAFGAHGLKKWLETDPDAALRLSWWSTATHYHLAHALLAAVFAVVLALSPSSSAAAKRARTGLLLVVVGTVLFSGSLYVMTLTNARILGAVTPFGGLALIAAWVMLALLGRRR
ncbi:MAG TPA: DUF423 domain-containing protein [Myxococcota bacterium]